MGGGRRIPEAPGPVRTVDTVMKSKGTLYESKMGGEDRHPSLFFDPHTWYVHACIYTHEHTHTDVVVHICNLSTWKVE